MEQVQRLSRKGVDYFYNRNGKYLMEIKYIVYITINLCNGKLYIGVHKTNPDVFDGYIGNGIYRQSQAKKDFAFHRAVKKYGYNNFKRITIKSFPNTEQGKKDAYALEAQLVNEESLKSKFLYNQTIGGSGSPDISLYKRVYMFDLKGNYLRSFKCSREAALFIDSSNVENIRQAIKNNCEGKTSSSFGYVWSYKKEFINPKSNKKPIAQYTLSGKFIQTYESITEAETLLELTSIQQAIAKGYQCGGYQWKFYKNNSEDIAPLTNVFTKNNNIPINMFKKDGTLIKTFSSINECIKEFPNLQASQINRVLKNIIKSHKGFVFTYKDKDIV